MKKCLITLAVVLMILPAVNATIITNTNQSATYLRLLARNASYTIDAVYYNPAGLTKLQDGFHFAFHNQTISQEKTINNQFPLFNRSEFVGKVSVPIFPNFYAVYKKGKFALSFGFGPNAGGGSADYANGLPSFESNYAMLPLLVSSFGIPTTQYSADINFSGSSIYSGFQLNASYAVSDIFSVAGGVRMISAKNTYEGSISNVRINPEHPLLNPGGGLMSAVQFFTMISQPGYAASVSDLSVDTVQTGTAFTPILSLCLTPMDGLVIAARYEFNTNLELTNDTVIDPTGLFPDGVKTRADIPAILGFGVEYAVMPTLRFMAAFNTYFDKQANWEGAEAFVDSNSYDIAVGAEYDISKAILISAGYMRTVVGVGAGYQSDMSHALSSSTIGFGCQVKILPQLDFDLGLIFVTYDEDSIYIPYVLGLYEETYNRSTIAIAVGLGYHPRK